MWDDLSAVYAARLGAWEQYNLVGYYGRKKGEFLINEYYRFAEESERLMKEQDDHAMMFICP